VDIFIDNKKLEVQKYEPTVPFSYSKVSGDNFQTVYFSRKTMRVSWF